jgi:hypothetical protein
VGLNTQEYYNGGVVAPESEGFRIQEFSDLE